MQAYWIIITNISYFVGSQGYKCFGKSEIRSTYFVLPRICEGEVHSFLSRWLCIVTISSPVSSLEIECLLKDIIIYCFLFIHFVRFAALHIQLLTVVFVMAAATTTASGYNSIVRCEMFDL